MDLLEALLKKKLANSEQEARGFILAGRVLVNDMPVTKPHSKLKDGDELRIRGVRKYVSRAGEKLAAALRVFTFPVAGRRFIDIGASTGGFTDALLQHGASYVAAIDVGRGLLHQKLRIDPRVQVIEDCDLRKLDRGTLHQIPEAFVVDVSFISLVSIVEKAFSLLTAIARPAEGIALFKPQFELPRSERGMLHKGVLADENRALQLIEDFSHTLRASGIIIANSLPSPVKGTKGNQEYLLHLQKQTAFTR